MEYNVDREKDAVLDAIMRQDPGNRGLLGASPENPVGALRESLRRAKRAVLLTGFPVRLPEGAVGETDGPPGTADMAWALEQFGTEVRALTDRFSYDQLSAAMKARGCRNVPEMLPENEEARRGFLEELFRTFRPTHCITLERPGKGEDGHFHNMRGIVIDDMVTDSQEILPMAKRYGAEIISVGDGGNELGMGALRELIEENVPFGKDICDSGISDIPLLAGVSNWWGWGIAAVLSGLAGRDLLPSDSMETEVLDAVIRSGGVDGVTAKPELTVDNLSLSQHLDVLGAVRRWVKLYAVRV